jgi:hypothetical protein
VRKLTWFLVLALAIVALATFALAASSAFVDPNF